MNTIKIKTTSEKHWPCEIPKLFCVSQISGSMVAGQHRATDEDAWQNLPDITLFQASLRWTIRYGSRPTCASANEC
jgi:hypothetical protein